MNWSIVAFELDEYLSIFFLWVKNQMLTLWWADGPRGQSIALMGDR